MQSKEFWKLMLTIAINLNESTLHSGWLRENQYTIDYLLSKYKKSKEAGSFLSE